MKTSLGEAAKWGVGLVLLNFGLLAGAAHGQPNGGSVRGLPGQPTPANPPETRPAAAEPSPLSPEPALTLVGPSSASPRDTTPDSLQLALADSAELANLRANADFESPVKYLSADSIVLSVDGQYIWLYNNAEVQYEDMELKAGRIRVDWGTTLVYAEGVQSDTGGDPTQTPVFQEGEDTYYAQDMTYNFKTRIGRIGHARTVDGENILYAEVTRRNADNTYYLRDGRFTTCDASHPHYYIQARRLKMITGKQIVSGRAQMYISDVPTPLIVPFGFFPSRQTRASGIILPEYGESDALGFFFRNMGYYWAVSDNLDLRFQGDIYTKGSYRASVGGQYIKRYAYQGRFDMSYMDLALGGFERGDRAFASNRQYTFQWRHQQQVSPQTRVNADVNYTTPLFQRLLTTQTQLALTNIIVSSVGYSTQIPNSAWNLTANARASQNLITRQLNLALPEVNFSRGRAFPFRTKAGTAPWRDNISLNYQAQLTNRIQVVDSLLFRPESQKLWQSGIQHTLAIGSQYNLFQHFTLTPSFNYIERWYPSANQAGYVQVLRRVPVRDPATGDTLYFQTFYADTVVFRRVNMFNAVRNFNAGVNLGTQLFGILQPGGKRQFTMRTTIRPTLGYSFQPDFGKAFWGYHYAIQSPTTGAVSEFATFNGQVFAGPGRGEQQSLNFGLGSTWEAKYLRTDGTGEVVPFDSAGKANFRYLTLLDDLSLSGAYNFAADSNRLSDIGLSMRSSVANNKVSIQLRGALDPYEQLRFVPNAENPSQVAFRRGTRYRLAADGGLGTLRQLGGQVGFNLASANRPLPTHEELSPEMRALRQQYMPFRIRWALNVAYSVNYANAATRDPEIRTGRVTHSLNFTGNVRLTPNWRIDYQTSFDVAFRRFAATTLNITRDLHCWEFLASTTFLTQGRNQYTMTIRVKSTVLRDLKLDKRRVVLDNFGVPR